MKALILGAAMAAAMASASPSAAAPPAAGRAPAAVEPDALAALQRMSAFLQTLSQFELKSVTTRELVLEDDQKVELGGAATYRVRRPNGFAIETVTGQKARDYLFDGKTFTISAPGRGYYARVPAPATIRQMLDVASSRFGIELPLDALVRWGEPDHGGLPSPTSGFRVGDAVIDGAQTDQYAFQTGDLDWQVWIAKGSQPLPRKLVIVDRSDPARPAYSARLDWNLDAKFASDAFTFQPPPGALPIALAQRGQTQVGP